MFKNPYEVVTVLLIQTLGAMVPSIPVCLGAAVERAAHEERLDTLLELHHTTSTFGRSLEAAMLPHLGLYKHETLHTEDVGGKTFYWLSFFMNHKMNFVFYFQKIICVLQKF